ncbi:hypothetical protein D9M68_918570 [compost metagenome]
MKAHVIGVFGKDPIGADGVEVGLEILHEVEALAAAGGRIGGIGGGPAGRHHAMRRFHIAVETADRAVESVIIPQHCDVGLNAGEACIVEVDPVAIAVGLEKPDDAEDGGMPA